MPEPIMTLPLAKDWILELWKRWSNLRESRRDELRRIANDFGVGSLELLAKTYVEPDCQRTNPADHVEDEPFHAMRQPVRDYFNRFLKGEFFEHDGRHVLFILSDAGMGKTSLLLMLKLTHEMQFWPSGHDFRPLKLGAETLKQIEEIEKRDKTVLLLDALDEDETAWGRIEERLEELLHATRSFRQVIVTCRTQFFPESGDALRERSEQVEIGGFVCNMFYLSPFSDEQVELYLRKRFPNRWLDELRKLFSKRDNTNLERARGLIGSMRSLRMRPMLLSYVDLLMEEDIGGLGEYAVYRALVDRWLWREEQKKQGGPKQEDFRKACMVVAMHLQRSGGRKLTQEDLQQLRALHPDVGNLEEIDVAGRSLLNLMSERAFRFAHYSIQEFLVAHRLITSETEVTGGTLRATDQLLRFLFSWAMEAPRERFAKIPWSRLDCTGVRCFVRAERAGVELVLVPGGLYQLGAEDIDPDSKPVHSVRLSPFWISRYPVTNAQYRRFLEANPRHRKPESWNDKQFNEPEQPVVGVSWMDAMAYCRWADLELPSEAQWEAAARGTDARAYPWGDDEPSAELANFDGREGRTTPVGAYPKGAGPYGTLDQAGNVWEWCSDVFKEDAYAKRDGEENPVVTGNDHDETAWRVVRGGSWLDPSWSLRAAIRSGWRARGRDQNLGFRVVAGVGSERGS